MNGPTPPYPLCGPARRKQRGASMMLIALLLLNLALLGVFAMSRAQSGFYRSIDLERRIEATYLAEAAINQGTARLYGVPRTGLTLPRTLVASTPLAGGSYSAVLQNNPNDPGGTVDTDNIFVIQGVGVSTGQTRRRTIDSTLEFTSLTMPTIPGAVVLGQDTTATLNGNTTVSGRDVGGSTPGVAGISFEETGQTVGLSGSYSVSGEPDFEWASGDYAGDPGYMDLAQQAIEICSASPTAVHLSGKARSALGTISAPQITVIDVGARATLSSTNGAGILIVRGQLDIVGNFQFNGLVLVEGDAVLQKTAGTANIVGGLVVTPPSAPTTTPVNVLRLSGNSSIKYSSSALQFANNLPWIRAHAYVTRN